MTIIALAIRYSSKKGGPGSKVHRLAESIAYRIDFRIRNRLRFDNLMASFIASSQLGEDIDEIRNGDQKREAKHDAHAE